MVEQLEPQKNTLELMAENLKKIKSGYDQRATLFSLEASMTKEEAVSLYQGFDSFLDQRMTAIKAAESTHIVSIITELMHYFNIALELLPALSQKAGDITNFIEKALDIYLGGGGGNWQSYSLQFGLPAGVSLSLHFETQT